MLIRSSYGNLQERDIPTPAPSRVGLEEVMPVNRYLATAALAVAVALAVGGSVALAHDLSKAPPPAPYVKVSELLNLPDFLPGMGSLYVAPDRLPVGPYLAYDRDGRLIQFIYMVPLSTLNGGDTVARIVAPLANRLPVQHLDLVFNPGHPGLAEPHYHIHLVTVRHEEELKRLAQE